MGEYLKNIILGNQIILSKKSNDMDIYLLRMVNGLYAVLVGKNSSLIYSRSFLPEKNKYAALKKAKQYYQKIKQLITTKQFDQIEEIS